MSTTHYEAQLSAPAEFVSLLWVRRRLLLLAGVAGLAIGISHVLVTDVAYRAEAIVAPVAQRRNLGQTLGEGLGMGDVLDMLPGVSGSKDPERMVATLVSNTFTLNFIQKRNLAQELLRHRWDADAGNWRESRLSWLPFVPDGPKPPTPNELIRRFSELRSVSLDRQTGLVRVRLDWHDAARASELVNQMVEDFNAFSRARAAQEAQRAIEYLTREMRTIEVAELREALARLMEDQMTKEMMATVQPEFALRVVDPAIPPDKSVRPRYVMTPGLWILATLATALAYLVARRRSARSVNPAN